MIELGAKHDQLKPRFDLLPIEPIAWIVDVLTFGAKKYAPGNWMHVPDAENRYFAATLRHLFAWRGGERLDTETQLPHLAHAATCLLFLIWFDGRQALRDSDLLK